MEELSSNEKGLLSKIETLTKERDSWKEAWYVQRLATGKAWWEGYRKGISVVKVFVREMKIPYLE
jgi:hypothetical protein